MSQNLSVPQPFLLNPQLSVQDALHQIAQYLDTAATLCDETVDADLATTRALTQSIQLYLKLSQTLIAAAT